MRDNRGLPLAYKDGWQPDTQFLDFLLKTKDPTQPIYYAPEGEWILSLHDVIADLRGGYPLGKEAYENYMRRTKESILKDANN